MLLLRVCAGLTQRDQDTLIHLEAFGVAVQKTRGRTSGYVPTLSPQIWRA